MQFSDEKLTTLIQHLEMPDAVLEDALGILLARIRALGEPEGLEQAADAVVLTGVAKAAAEELLERRAQQHTKH